MLPPTPDGPPRASQALSPQDLAIVKAGMSRLAAGLNPPPPMRLEEFFRKAFEIIEPGKTLIDSWHIPYICEHLEAVSRGEIKRLLINVPPRSLKSSIVSVAWPTWQWGPFQRPESRFMFISHEIGLGIDLAVARRAILDSDWYRENWPRVVLSSDQNEKKLIQNTRRGKLLCTSTHGAAAGKGGDFLVPDDFIDPEKADSDTERNRALESWRIKFSSRLDNKKTGAIVAIEQRTHPNDFTAQLVEAGGYTHLVIPSDNYTKEPMRFTFPKSKREIVVEPGAAVMPEIKPMDVVLQERKEKGTRIHETQERQNPQAAGGVIFNPTNWRYYADLEALLWRINRESGAREPWPFDELLQSWDLSFKGTEDSDFVVGQVWGRRGADRFLLDQFREQVGVLGTIKAIETMYAKWPRATRKLIEDKANGPAVMEMLKSRVPGLIAVNPQGGKIVRARAVEPIQESNNIYLPAPAIASWVIEFVERSRKFPNVDYDDEIDAMTQANIYFTSNNGPMLSIG